MNKQTIKRQIQILQQAKQQQSKQTETTPKKKI